MFNCFKKIITGESHNKQSLNSCFCSLITAFVLVSGAINIARADVCFLPDSKGCEMVPYEEYACTGDDCNQEPAQECEASNYCYATEAEAIAARGVTVTRRRPGSAIVINSVYDSYEKSGDCYCLKNSCGKILSNILMVQREGYDLSEAKGEGWNCEQCKDTNSQFYNNYRCTAKECVENSSVSCVTDGDECKTCVERGYSGDNVCQELQTIAAHCPNGYVPDKPNTKCYSTQDMLCGEGKCYQAPTTIPDCSGEGKQLSDDNGACWCSCKTGYHFEGVNCVLNQCSSGVAENTCDTANGYTFEPNNTSFENANGDTVRCGSCVIDCPNYIEVPSTQIPYVVERSQSPGGQGNIDYDTGPLAINIATIGGYSCDYNIYATGKIAHHFEIKDVNGNLLTEITDLGSGIYPKQVNDLYLYTLPAGQTVNIMVRRKVSGHVIVGWSGKIYLSR